MASEVKIECPKCAWEPDGGAYWQCTCGHIWDTFSTAARCPVCAKQWEYTQCIPHRGGCVAMSPHLDWYKGLDRWLEEELASISELAQKKLKVTD
jgi:hypothetical protein